MWNFMLREARCSGGLFHIEARSNGSNDRHRRWFTITEGTHITKAKRDLENTVNLTKLAETIYAQRYG